MASYEVEFAASVRKDLRRLPREVVSRVMARIAGLASDPYPQRARQVHGAERLYRVRVGDYRVLYRVDAAHRRVTIAHVGHRRDVYRRPGPER
jgi:mRNA interferase RelE/StbE